LTAAAPGLAVFDKLAAQYDALWSDTAIGKAQRQAVWHYVDPLFRKGETILDVGCGTGVDGEHYLRRGVIVHGIDASAQMVEVARQRGVAAVHCPIEELSHLDLQLDGALSNFGAVNCVNSLAQVAQPLARMIRPGGYLPLCVLNRFCAWETSYFLSRADTRRAFRRWSGHAASSIGATVCYPSSTDIYSVFCGPFEPVASYGIGIAVPPSYVSFLSAGQVNWLARIDFRIAHWPLFKSLADHRLYIFRRK
jgi:ubiquinone/menaquinone biosynthesis C-methylase UbiE